MTSPAPARPLWPVLLVAVLSGAAQLAVGFLYLVSGLAVPGYAWLPLLLWWALLTTLLIRLALQRSWWTPLVPLVAVGTWLLVIAFGGNVLGWTA